MKASLFRRSSSLRETTLKLVLPLLVALIVMVNIIFFTFLPLMEEGLVEEKRFFLGEVTRLMKERLEKDGAYLESLGVEDRDIQDYLIEAVRVFRYGKEGDDYFWIFMPQESGEIFIPSHPNRQDLVGPDISAYKGFNETFIMQDMVRTARDGGGYLWYLWNSKTDPEVPVQKLSYLVELSFYDWVLGTGVYVNDIEDRMAELRRRFFRSSLFGIFIIALLSLVLIWNGSRISLGRERVERELKFSEERFRRIFDNTYEFIALLAVDGRVMAVNRTALDAVYVKDESEIIGKLFWETPWWGGEAGDGEELRKNFLRVVDGESIRYESSNFVRGKPAIIDLSLKPLLSPEGKVVQVVVEGQDITQLREAIQQLNRKNEELLRSEEKYRTLAAQLEKRVARRTAALEKSNADLQTAIKAADAATLAKGEFLANMSHELRTPLSGVITAASLALDQKPGGEVGRFLEIISGSGKTLMKIINDVLDYSKLEAGRMELEQHTVSLSVLVNDLKMLFQSSVEEKDLDFRCVLDPRLPPTFRGDPLRIQQVLTNLVGNAVKFTGPGGEILLRMHEVSSPGADGTVTVGFEVKDNGVGIPPEQQEKLFSPFTQADSSTTRTFGGTGLGLTISRRLVEQMGGVLRLESREGEGSTFSFEIEVHPYDVPLRLQEKAGESRPGGDYGALQGKKILVAEDNRTNRELLAVVLSREGLEVEFSENGEEALRLMEETRFDAVLMDVQMPRLDGYTATRRIRENPRWKELPIIAMTAHALAGDRDRCLTVGMNDYLAKPVERDTLLEILVKNLSPGTALPLIDRKSTQDRLRVGESVLDEIYTLFIEDGEQVLKTLSDAMAERDEATAIERAHTLKGMAGNVGAKRCSEEARRLEAALREGGVDAGAAALKRVRSVWQETRGALENRDA